jgi:uncharacterized protein YuzE
MRSARRSQWDHRRMVEAHVALRIRLDEDADAAYIYLADEIAPGGVARTVTLDHADAMINIDFDADGRALGVEILAAQSVLPADILSHLRR